MGYAAERGKPTSAASREELAALGVRPPNARVNTRIFLHSEIAEADLHAIRERIRQERAFGSECFQRIMAKTLNRPVAVRSRGGPHRGLHRD